MFRDPEFNQTEIGRLLRKLEDAHYHAVKLDAEAQFDDDCRISDKLLRSRWDAYYAIKKKFVEYLKKHAGAIEANEALLHQFEDSKKEMK